jgi:hypothetical protein
MACAGMAKLIIALTVACATVAHASESTTCKLPQADAREGASAPMLDGTITGLRNSCFRVVSRLHPEERPKVCVTAQTTMFTVYGGDVAANELREGQRVHVWVQGCRPPVAGSPSQAAVIEVASLTPGEDFP